MPNERDQKNDQSEVKAPESGAPAGDVAAAPGQGATDVKPPVAEVESADPAASRQARLAEIDRELVEADRQLVAVQARIQSLRTERDELRRRGFGKPMSQAEALKQVVQSDQDQRMNRAALAAAVTGLVGSNRMPTVKTPAEIKAAMTKKPVQLPRPQQ